MKRVEFIGGSGVGKSTLLKEVIRMRKSTDSWMTPREAKFYLAKTVKPKSMFSRLFQIYLKTNLIRRYQYTVASHILNGYHAHIFENIYKKYHDVARLYLDILCKNNENNSLLNMRSIRNYYNLLFNDVILFDYFQLYNLVVYDEGIIFRNPAFINKEKSDIVFKNLKNKQTSIIPTAIIYCYINSLGEYRKRREERIIKGEGKLFERIKTEKELKKICPSMLESAEKKVSVLKSYNIPILEVDMEKPVQKNAKIVYEYICRFQ